MRTWLSTVLLLLGSVRAQEPAPLAATPPPYDLLVLDALVIDGTGQPGVEADVAVKGDRIVAVGNLGRPDAKRVLGGHGLVLAPGFVDLHAHADSVATTRGDAANFVAMGVTTLVTGNCGGSVDDVAAHLSRVEEAGISLNYGTLIGHGTVRQEVLQLTRRAPTAAELAQMQQLVTTAMEAGAFGLSTGLIYVPGAYAKTDELVALARTVAAHGGIYASHIRNENNDVLLAIDEALAIGAEAAVPVHLSHLKASGRRNHGRSDEILTMLRAARADGRAVTADQYVYPASSTGLEVLFPTEALEVGRAELARRIAADPDERNRMRDALHAARERVGFTDFAYCRIAHAPKQPQFDGMTIDAVAAELRGATDVAAQAETILDLFVAAAGARVQMVYHAMAEQDVERILAEDWIAVASDAGIFVDGNDKPHPRGAGNNARVLGHYVRERAVLSLPLAVRKMSDLPARTFGIEQRGRIAPGWYADFVLFDPVQVADRATWTEPKLAPGGIPFVVVNGVVVIDEGRHTGARPGRVLRHRS